MSTDIPAEIQQIADNARDSFDLGTRLRGRSKRTKKVRVFTDEVTGERLGGHEMVEEINHLGLRMTKPRVWGLMGDIIKLQATPKSAEENAEQIAEMKKEVGALARTLEESALDIELRAIPRVVKKDAHRAAREALGISEKISPDHARYDDYVDEHDAQILVRTVVSIFDAEDDQLRKGITVENARALKELLPEWEYAKISRALNELLWQNSIAEKAVEDADFSLGI
ncbi:MAG: hypothetical protein K0Q52_119 [Microbacterium sp.]|jgi:hypothetical protein|nr:hypothetical protein [Microbacterium sp.]